MKSVGKFDSTVLLQCPVNCRLRAGITDWINRNFSHRITSYVALPSASHSGTFPWNSYLPSALLWIPSDFVCITFVSAKRHCLGIYHHHLRPYKFLLIYLDLSNRFKTTRSSVRILIGPAFRAFFLFVLVIRTNKFSTGRKNKSSSTNF